MSRYRSRARPRSTENQLQHIRDLTGFKIPWTMISGPTSIRTRAGERLGIALDQPAQEYVANQLTSKPSSQRTFLWFMKHYGAIPVAPAKDAGLGDLRAISEGYRIG
jgi:hypothetical protein